MYCLDSDILSLLYYEHAKATARLDSVDAATVFVPVASRVEVLRGRIEAVLKAADGTDVLRAADRLLATERFLAQFRIIPVDQRVAEHFDRLRANKKLRKIGVGDLLNASIALSCGATLVARNTKDFANVQGLTVENWAD
jgi:tRNA(fMet)-specific endonuclease VapC